MKQHTITNSFGYSIVIGKVERTSLCGMITGTHVIRPSAVRVFALFVGFILTATQLSADVIPVTDSNVLNGLTRNNWVLQNDFISTSVGGASLQVAFDGTDQVTLQLDDAHLSGITASRCPIIAWSVNGGPIQTHQLTTAESSIALCSDVPNPEIDLFVKGMSPFENRYSGDVPPNSVKITGFIVDSGGSTREIELPQKVWLNIGDSIMSGDAAAYAAGQGRPADDSWAASDDARASYGYLLAKHFGYREARLAFGGYDWGGGLAGVPSLTTLIDQKTSTISRLKNGLLDPVPEVVLINLGENGAPSSTDVTQALTRLRSRVNPRTKIIVMIPVAGTARVQITQAFSSYTNATPDANAFLVDLGSLNFSTADGQHPTAEGHQTIYQAALPVLESIVNPAPFRICAMGDSITAGFTDNPQWTVPFEFGYRSGLYTRLNNSGMSFQFVGSSPQPWDGIDGTVTNTPLIDLRESDQDHHEGYSGKNTAFFLANMANWIGVDRPHVLLLQIGINDIGKGSTGEPTGAELNLSNIIATVVSNSPQTHVIVAQITPYSSYTEAIVRYDNYIKDTLVPYFAGLGKRVTTVNQYTNLCFPGTTTIDASLFANGINHPNNIAYDRMAQTWFEGIQALNLPPSPPTQLPIVVANTQPATAKVFVGESISFNAAFESDQPMVYQWHRIQGGVTNAIPGATNSILTLVNLQTTDNGSYFLQASNALGIASSASSSLTVSDLPAAADNIITAIAEQTGRGIGVFTPGWIFTTNHSLIAGKAPSSAIGNFSLEAPGRNVNSLTSDDDGALSVIVSTSGATSSTNYVTCGNGGGAGSSVTYTLTGSTYGYDLTNVTVFGGWADNGRDQQAYTVFYSTVMDPQNFLPLTTVNFNPEVGSGRQSATRVAILPATGNLATNVAMVKFDFSSPASEHGYCGYNKIIIEGSAGAPVTIVTNPPPPLMIESSQFGTSSSAFDGAIALNLIRAGQSSLAGVVVSHGPSISSLFTTAGLNDGSAANNNNRTYYGNSDPSGGNLPVTITFNLNTNSASGYDLTRIQSITGWSDSNLANLRYELLLSFKGGPFVSYGEFSSATNSTAFNNGNNAILHTVSSESGIIGHDVTAVRFIFSNPGGMQGGSGGTLIRELQVFGTPVVNLSAKRTAENQLQLSWPQGVLLEATNVAGPWITNDNAASPHIDSMDAPEKYFRVQVQ